MRIVGYIRVSTDYQVTTQIGLDFQEQAIHEYAKKNNIETVVVHRDEGISGALGIARRPGLLRALNELTKDSILVVDKRDRLARDIMVMAMIESMVSKKKSRIISLSGEGTADDSPSSILLRRMVDIFSEHERLLTSERVKVIHKVKKERREPMGILPFGYRRCDNGKKFERDPDQQKILKRIVTLRNNGTSFQKIANRLNNEKIYNRDNLAWTKYSINKAYKHYHTWGAIC